MENYFILLELPFDLPESDTNKISEAISKKQAQWSRDQSNPVKKAKASEYLAALEDIKKVMLDPTARKQEAAKAKQIKASKAKELEAKLSLYRAKGDELSEKDLKRLVKVFGAFGFTADEIKKKFGSGNKKQDKIDPSEVLDKTQARNVQNFMQQLDMKEKTLYDFLSLAPTASWNQLCEAADSMKKKILAKGDKTGRDNAVQSLCGLCVVIFKDVASKKKYDNYVNLTKYRAVNEAVDELALSNQKRIEPKMKESLIDIAVRQYHVSVSDASVYINHYCEYMGYALPENKIVCGLCGTENPAGTTNCVKCGKPLIIPSVINDGETIMVLTNAVNDCSVKELSKMDSAFLQRVCQIRAKVDKSGLEKIKAVFIGEMLTANNAQRKRPVNLSGELAQTGISLKSVEKSDYEAYIKNYFDEYFVLLQASEDVPALMRIFYHGRYFSNFIDDYISVLKKKAKKETERWKRILAWTCVYLVTAERSDQAAEVLYKPIVRYLRSLDEDRLLDVRQAVIQDVPSSRCDYLFDEVRRKEGFVEKLGGFFHKK